MIYLGVKVTHAERERPLCQAIQVLQTYCSLRFQLHA